MGKEHVIPLDFSQTQERSGAVRVPPGEYVVKVVKVLEKQSQKDKPYLLWQLKGLNGALKGQTIFHITSLQPQALFNLENTLLSCKIKVGKRFNLKVDKHGSIPELVGKILGIVVDDDEYKGRTRSRVIETFPVTIKDGKPIKEALPTDDELTRDDEDIPEDIDDEDEEDEEEDEEEIEVEDEEEDDKDL